MPNAFRAMENRPVQAAATLQLWGVCLLRSLIVAAICVSTWLIQPSYAILPAIIVLAITPILLFQRTSTLPVLKIQFCINLIAYAQMATGNAVLLPPDASGFQALLPKTIFVIVGLGALLLLALAVGGPAQWNLRWLKDRAPVMPGTYYHPTFVALTFFLFDRGGALVSLIGLYGMFVHCVNDSPREIAWPYLVAVIAGPCGPMVIAPLIRSHFKAPDVMPKKPGIPYLGPSQYVDRGD